MGWPFPKFGPSPALAALACAFVLELAACTGPAPVVVNPKYRDADLHARVVHVLPVRDASVGNPDDFDDDLRAFDGQEPSVHAAAVVTRLFKRPLQKHAQHVTLAFDSAWDSADAALRDTILSVPSGKKMVADTFAYPPGRIFRDKNIEPDLALQIEHVEFRRNIELMPRYFSRSPFGMPGGPVWVGRRVMGHGTRKSLDLTGRYILWDCRTEEPVAYGRFSASSVYTIEMRHENWEDVVTQAVRALVAGSPLKAGK
jgi:hypothetical protein